MLTLREYQRDAIISLFDYFSEKKGNPILVMPTGTGKSLVIAEFIRMVLERHPYERFVVLTHVQELIEQNSQKLYQQWPLAPIGINSAGMKSRDTMQQIIFGGVQSVYKSAQNLGHRNLMIIDECHLLSPKDSSMYQVVIDNLRAINPKLKVIGLSATPYRSKQGMLTEGEGNIFTDICYDISGVDEFNKLIDDGYLCKLIPKRTDLQIDTSNVRVNAGEFVNSDLQEKIDIDDINIPAIQESIKCGHNRNSWLVFTTGITHCEHVTEILMACGIPATCVHSKISNGERTKRIESFKRGEVTAMVNSRVLTTGFDHPGIDMIIDLQPTLSPGLHVQKYGRGTRPLEGKQNCLVLDFAGNTARLGPINDPVLPRKPGKKEGMPPPIKICEVCGAYNHASVRICQNCEVEFPRKDKQFSEASTVEIIKTNEPVIEEFQVDNIFCSKHTKAGSEHATLKVTYVCGLLKTFTKYVCLEHSGFARTKACEWWRQMHVSEPPLSVDEALKYAEQLRVPKLIHVNTNTKWPEIVSYEW